MRQIRLLKNLLFRLSYRIFTAGHDKALIELNKQGKVSFQNVVTFNMDEYVGLPEVILKATIHLCGKTFLTTLI